MSGMYEALDKAGFGDMLEKKAELNKALDKYSQPMRPGPNLDEMNATAANILRRGKEVIKSSKGKHGSNYTPPKKKRKK